MVMCGYLDLLGTRNAAQISSENLWDKLNNFHSCIDRASHDLDEGHCIAFSDGAFLKINSGEGFLKFYKTLRNLVFQKGDYFRCSLVNGNLAVTKRGSDIEADGSLPRFLSITFTESGPDAYTAESRFKGIGCIIDPEIKKNNAEISAASVASFFLTRDRLEPKEYLDIKYDPAEMRSPEVGGSGHPLRLYDPLLRACHAALADSRSISSMYISPLVTMVRSCDVKNVHVENDDASDNIPYIIEDLLSPGTIKILNDIPGVHLLYLACFDHIYSQNNGEMSKGLERLLITRMMRLKNCFRNLDRVPSFVIKPKAKQALVEWKVAATRRR